MPLYEACNKSLHGSSPGIYLSRLETGKTNSTITPTVMNPHPPCTIATVPFVEPQRMKKNPISMATAGNAEARPAKIEPKTVTGSSTD